MAGMRPPQPSRETLLSEYGALKRQMVKVGLEPTVSDAILEVFSDGELAALVKDSALRLIRFRRLESEL